MTKHKLMDEVKLYNVQHLTELSVASGLECLVLI